MEKASISIINSQSDQIEKESLNSKSESEINYVTEPATSVPKHDHRTKVQLIWENITYVIEKRNESTQILKGVSGQANPGELLVIMGNSGAGKTTLLNILAGRLKSLGEIKINGTVAINGTNIKDINFGYYSAYVTQEDILLPTLTTRESLLFSSKLRLPGTHEEHVQRVEKIIEDLKLTRVADNVIGSVTSKGLSGGERKRVCIGIELITEPLILILDEPTSGLDSFTAEIVVDLLLEQARKGRTVITTIHQPSSGVFSKFDRLVLMCEGNIIYQGRANESRKYFGKLGFKCPKLMNPADYFMRLLHVVDRKNISEDEKEKLKILVSAYSTTDPESEIIDPSELEHLANKIFKRPSTQMEQFKILFKRSNINSRRNPIFGRVKYMQAIVMAVLLDLTYNNIGTGYSSIQDRNGVLFVLTMMGGAFGSQNSSLSFPSELPLFFKETKQGLYSTISYYVAKSIAELPNLVMSIFLQALIIYWAVGLNNYDASKFFIFYAALLVLNVCGTGIGYIVGALFHTETSAMIAEPIFVIPFLLFAGQFANVDRIPIAFRWVQYISPFKYGFEALCINEYTDLNLPCQNCDSDDCTKCDPLDDLAFYDSLGESFLYNIIIIIVFRIIAYLLLWITAVRVKR
ncbi:unnamed protein product [Blepharisma stoltei]|uniref:ABC transporter domain-containing protein n=1 Tax=Blepharisma stoltei TaxID=1481888 RepID=A0AAU9IPH3_9CILI|nr:unnamed protein product [Blepharisma stoltei]